MMSNLASVLDDWPLWGISKKPIEAHQVKLLNGGLTNISYHLMLESGDYILRVNAANTEALGIDRDREKTIHQLVAKDNITSPIRYTNDENSYLIRDYIVGEVLSESVGDAADLSDSVLSYMVEKLKELHHLPINISLPKLNISDIAESYWKILEANNPEDEMLKMKPLMQVAMREPPAGEFCLCHMDPVLANWLYTASGLQLLDWEYAGLAHPLWDLAALWQGIKDKLNASEDKLLEIEEKLIALYGVKNHSSWRRANIQMEYLSSLWYRAQN